MRRIIITTFLMLGIGSLMAQDLTKEAGVTFKNGLSTFNKKPFKKSKDVALVSVNLRFRLATRQEDPKDANNVTWAFLQGIDSLTLQNIANQYYKILEEDLKAAGYTLNTSYRDSKNYKSLVDDNLTNERVTSKPLWGIAEIYTANGDTYIEFPNYAGGAHAKLAKDVDAVIWQSLITIDFVDIAQRELDKKEYQQLKSEGKLPANMKDSRRITETSPKIKLLPNTIASTTFKGDGTYSRFSGPDFSGGGVFLNGEKVIYSDVPLTCEVNPASELPNSLKRFKSNVLGDLAAIATKGAVKTGRGQNENYYYITTNAEAFNASVMDVLKKYNALLFAHIKANN